MSILFKVVELNSRRGDTVVCNGFEVDIDLPALSGTEKQVAWAIKIRDKVLREEIIYHAQKHPLYRRSGLMSVAEHDDYVAQLNTSCSKIAEVAGKAGAAAFWIDMRGSSFRDIMSRLVAEHGAPVSR